MSKRHKWNWKNSSQKWREKTLRKITKMVPHQHRTCMKMCLWLMTKWNCLLEMERESTYRRHCHHHRLFIPAHRVLHRNWDLLARVWKVIWIYLKEGQHQYWLWVRLVRVLNTQLLCWTKVKTRWACHHAVGKLCIIFLICMQLCQKQRPSHTGFL